jgi:Protein of unknown function (DUF3099)
VKRAPHDDSAVLITAAAPSGDDQYAARKRKYITMMLMRIPCLILAGIFAQQVWWLAVIFVVISIPLPWIAVLIANDRPARKKEHVHRFRGTPDTAGELEQRHHEIIDG